MLDIEQTLTSLGYKLDDRGAYWQTNALFRQGDNKTAIQIYKNSGVWKDYVNQTPYMPFKKLIQLTVGTNDDDIASGYIKEMEQIDFSPYNPLKERVTMEKTYDKDCLNRLLPHYDFYEKRGISSKTLSTFQAGLCTEGKMYQRFVFPIYNKQNKIHGFSGRYMGISENAPKWKHMGVKSKWLYPHHISEKFITQSNEVILVESIGDVLSLYENNYKNSLCCFGTDISPSLCSYLVQCNPSKIFISLNNDSSKDFNVGLFGAIKIFFKLFTMFDYDKIFICLPNKNDFGDMSSSDFASWDDKRYSINKDSHYNNIVRQAEMFCESKNQPESFIKKIKKFKKEINDE
tara:strand:+ start:12305 stop:13342 length:1038 start_codon:yes stop_codon:yes gene_type:complete